jgi:lipopolysaccharide biosynthesis regulator YciM
MNFEIWWLLVIPLFFLLGWLSARIDIKQVVTESRALPNSYFRGLNFLLNEQPDRAIEAFVEVVRLEPETIDLHFALGGLFRKRGELERAIRMHENLLERESLPEEQRLRALAELGQDYLKAGLLDRAEQMFEKLLGTALAGEARRNLLEIHVQVKDWRKAIAAARELERESTRPMQSEIAHYHCELALLELMAGRHADARAYLGQALQIHANSVRANMMLGDLLVTENRHEEAIATWRQIESQQPASMVLVVDRLLASHKALGDLATGLVWLRGLLGRRPSLDLFNALYLATSELQGAEAAYQLAREELRRHPSLRALDKLIEAELLDAPSERREVLQNARNVLQGQIARVTRYHCAACGFKAKAFFWRCPACGRWDSFDPERREE